MGKPRSHEQIFRNIYTEIAQNAADLFDCHVLGQCKSPIEKIMASHLLCLTGGNRDDVYFHSDPYGTPLTLNQCKDVISSRLNNRVSPDDNWMVFPQVSVGRYKIDFLIFSAVSKIYSRGSALEVDRHCLFAVECDGHDFHEKSKEQAAHDKKRDRAIQIAGVPILRFTGSEIYRDPIGVINEISRYASSITHPKPIDAIDLEICWDFENGADA